jgi:hypothetical protein
MEQKQRTKIKEIIKLRKQQIITIEIGILQPLRDNIKLAHKVLKGEKNYETFKKHIEQVQRIMKELFRL